LEGVQGTEAMLLRILSQELLSPVVIFFKDSPDDELLQCGTFADSSKKSVRFFRAHRPGSKLYGGYRGEFKQPQPGCEDTVAALGENLTDCLRSEFLVEPLYQCAGIEEVQHRLPVSAFLDDRVAERARNILQSFLYLFGGWCWFVPFGGLGLALRKVLVVVTVIQRFDDEGDALFIVERHALHWMEHAIFVDGFNVNSHGSSLTDLFQEAH